MEGKAPVDFFRLMFDDRVMNLILMETNRYASQYLEREKEHLQSHPKARAHEWCKNVLTQNEVEAFIALLIAMGMCGFPTLRYVPIHSRRLPLTHCINVTSIVQLNRK